ncbi:MAG: thiamine diphosphokinase [Treponema sp.]|nr:thiamine diphosphokinase [Treponema sp.]
MLGIVFTGGESPSSSVIRGLLDGKEIFAVAADSGLVAAEEAGIKPALVIGDMDSIDASRLSAYPPQSVMRYKHDKDYTDTELALREVIKKGCDEIWVIGGGGGRIDHLFGIRSLFERAVFPRRWITGSEDIFCIDANTEQKTLSMKLRSGAPVSVFPLGNAPWEAESAGLKWPLAGLKWDRGFFGLSNVAPDGNFSITAQAGRFMVILPLREVF